MENNQQLQVSNNNQMPSLELQLTTTLKDVGVTQLLSQANEECKMILAEMERGLTYQKALDAKKMFMVKQAIGEESLFKVLALVIKKFADGCKCKETLTPSEIIELADDILNTYTHDSVKDIMLAFKEARKSDKQYFNKLTQQDIWEVIKTYFDKKAEWLEYEHKQQKQQTDYTYQALAKNMSEKENPEDIERAKEYMELLDKIATKNFDAFKGVNELLERKKELEQLGYYERRTRKDYTNE